MNKNHIHLDQRDNVAVAVSDIEKGAIVPINSDEILIGEHIKQKHKFALKDFAIGDEVIMYGVLVGKAIRKIAKGTSITTENLKHASSEYSNTNESYDWIAPDISKFEGKKFNGYHRKDGRVGTANNWLIIPLTFCENRNIDVIEGTLSEKLGYYTKKDYALDIDVLIHKFKNGASEKEILETPISSSKEELRKNRLFPNVDGIKFLKHDGGCGGTRQDAETLCKLLAGYINNPNVAGATVLSLGCQNAQISMMQNALDVMGVAKPVHFLEQQQSKSERSFIEEAVKLTFIGLSEANKIVRKPAPLSKLVLGLECGGSDGFSGISANPALGYASDLLVALGGSPVLSEFPELNGVEQELINRCETTADADKFCNLMRSYAQAAIDVGSGFENNPSPGNIADGLITDAMKSAGAAKKGGTSPVTKVLDYTEQVKTPGLHLLCTPGNDVESTTGLVGSGCNVVVFTTGLGTPTGNPIAPVLKMSSNSDLFNKMNDIIDINAGTVITGEDSIVSMGEKILDYIIEVASGTVFSKAEILGNNDFIPWKRGVSL